MLLKKKGRKEKKGDYPTMFLIISGLFKNLRKAISYFQYDSLWKSQKIASNTERSHDVHDRKGVSLNRGKDGHLFSIRYRQENDGSWNTFGAKPTMCMMEKHLRTNQQLPSISYVIEKRTRSSLAVKTNRCQTHDVYEAERLILKRRLSGFSRSSNTASLYVASELAFQDAFSGLIATEVPFSTQAGWPGLGRPPCLRLANVRTPEADAGSVLQ
jgi:hypothetical protein